MTVELKKGFPYQIILNDHKHFVGYLEKASGIVLQFRTGTDNRLILLKSEIKKITPISPRDVETRKKTGRFFIY